MLRRIQIGRIARKFAVLWYKLHTETNFSTFTNSVSSTMFAGLRTVRGYAASGNMEQLMQKLNNLNKAAPVKETAPAQAKAASKKAFKGNKKKANFWGKNNQKGQRRERAEGKEAGASRNGQRGGQRNARQPPRTVSQYDRFRNPNTKKKARSLNAKGDQFAQETLEKAAFIKRKSGDVAKIDIKSRHEIIDEFVSSVVKHEPRFAAQCSPFAKFTANEHFQLENVNKAELELSKDKLGYDAKSRMLRALEQIVTKRGYTLTDANKVNFQYLPYNTQLYPFANTTLPANLMRNQATLKTLSNVSPQEIQETVGRVVLGQRPDIKFDPKAQYKTVQLRVNAQVVANSLNSNAQLQVDSLHAAMAPVLVGAAPIKTLPQAVLPPKKL